MASRGSEQKSLQEYPFNAEVSKAPFLVPHYSYYASITLVLSVILLCYVDNAPLYSKCEQTSDLWQQLELACEHKSDLEGTLD